MKKECNYRCEECKFSDCINDDITDVEIMESEIRNVSYGYVIFGKPKKMHKSKRKV